jgi:RimJ/RimL family protein N-acetyltransferase
MNSIPAPSIMKATKIQGRTLIFRDANEADAAFILALRTDEQKSRYLSTTNNDVNQQKLWLANYAGLSDQAYFIIENFGAQPLGTVRLYDARQTSFCWGSWILKGGAPSSAAIESALMVYSYAIDYLGFSAAHFEVRRDNESVWRFHERFGATRLAETSLDYIYEINGEMIQAACKKYRKYLPSPISLNLGDKKNETR